MTVFPPRIVTVAAIQTHFTKDRDDNLGRLSSLIEEARDSSGAKIVLLPELCESPYFCSEEKDDFFSLAQEMDGNSTLQYFQTLSKKSETILIVPFFEKDGPHYYNSVVALGADGSSLGHYRKSHIPDGPGYEEKYYFRPGNTGFKAIPTPYGKIGIAICWDQWFPECARAMMLEGAEILFYPSAIGTEPQEPSFNTQGMWQTAMLGHSVSNIVPVVCSNRIGNEGHQTFYGHSFISNELGIKVAEMGSDKSGFIAATFNFDAIAQRRASFGFFRDRRPDLYHRLTETR